MIDTMCCFGLMKSSHMQLNFHFVTEHYLLMELFIIYTLPMSIKDSVAV